MRTILKKCDNCKEETFHRTKKRVAKRGRGTYHTKREIEHCDKCNRRIVKNSRFGTYKKWG